MGLGGAVAGSCGKGASHSSRVRGMRLPKILFLQPMLFSLYLGSQKRKNDQNEWKEIKHHHEKEKKKKQDKKERKRERNKENTSHQNQPERGEKKAFAATI